MARAEDYDRWQLGVADETRFRQKPETSFRIASCRQVLGNVSEFNTATRLRAGPLESREMSPIGGETGAFEPQKPVLFVPARERNHNNSGAGEALSVAGITQSQTAGKPGAGEKWNEIPTKRSGGLTPAEVPGHDRDYQGRPGEGGRLRQGTRDTDAGG